jgi:Bacterial regulatory helix-turn-helix protein, lysR family
MITSRVEYFLAAWRERSFSRAALRCGVSQPSLTNGIKSLGGPWRPSLPEVPALRVNGFGKTSVASDEANGEGG